jgi:hypothetical protein
MAYMDDQSLDALLSDVKDNYQAEYICSAEPATYTEATSTYALGSKTSPATGAIGDRTGGGRKFTVSAINDGSVSADGTASHYAGVDNTNSRLKVAEALSATQVVSNGNTYTLTAHDIGIPDAA